MVRPSSDEIARLARVAREIRDTTEESGFNVDGALRQHEAFTVSRRPSSALERSLVLDAARRGASQAGLFASDSTDKVVITTREGATQRFYRVKTVKFDPDGSCRAICGAGSSLIRSDPDSLFQEEKWILGYVPLDDHTIGRIVLAEIIGFHGSGPVHLEFGAVIDLTDDQLPARFVSTDEDLEGFEEDGDAGSADAV